MPAGLHTLVARDPEGREIERERVEVRAGRPHLFAPASAGHCFWLETREYGRDAVTEVAREPLEGPPYFWALPQNLGGWFLPAPEATKSEARLTGGAVTVLRQGPCRIEPSRRRGIDHRHKLSLCLAALPLTQRTFPSRSTTIVAGSSLTRSRPATALPAS